MKRPRLKSPDGVTYTQRIVDLVRRRGPIYVADMRPLLPPELSKGKKLEGLISNLVGRGDMIGIASGKRDSHGCERKLYRMSTVAELAKRDEYRQIGVLSKNSKLRGGEINYQRNDDRARAKFAGLRFEDSAASANAPIDPRPVRRHDGERSYIGCAAAMCVAVR